MFKPITKQERMKVKDQNLRIGIENWLKLRLHYDCNETGEMLDISYWGFLQKIMTDPNAAKIIKKLNNESERSVEIKSSPFIERYFRLNFGEIHTPKSEYYPNIEQEYNQMFSAGFVLLCISFLLDEDDKMMKSALKKNVNNSGCLFIIPILIFIVLFIINK